jgi:tetratricopeptide (TPR) repeat protein
MRTTTILIAMLVTAPLAAEAKPKAKAQSKAHSVKTHMDRAGKAHKAKKFDVALTELEAAYAIEPQPKLLFAIAQVQAKLDRCQGAIENYEKFLASTKDKQKQAIVKQAIASCRTKIAADTSEPTPASDNVFRDKKPVEEVPVVPTAVEPTPAPTPEPTPAPTPAPPPAPIIDDAPPPRSSIDTPIMGRGETPPGSGSRPWYKDVVGDALVVGGVASGALSVVMYLKAQSELDDAESAGSLDGYEQLVNDAHDHRTYAVIFAGAGVVLVGGGLLRYALHDSDESRGVALAPTSGGAVVTWSGGF